MSAKGKRTFWVIQSETRLHAQRIELLNNNGFDVIVLTSYQDVLAATAIGRPSCILIDTPETDNPAVIRMIGDLTALAELNGVRFILSSVSKSPEATTIAVSENFRDIIPLQLSEDAWLLRIQYTTAIKASASFPSPLCEISLNQVASIRAPGRVVWINETHLRIECRGSMHHGSTLQMTGAISEALQVGHLSLTVESVHKSHLVFRFSQALICRWRVPGANAEASATMIRKMLIGQQSEAKLRAYIVASNANIRKSLTTGLRSDRFELKIGLQRHTIAKEVEYFSPDVVFLDSPILKSLTPDELLSIFEKLPGDVPVIVYGSDVDKVYLKTIFKTRQVYFESAPDPMSLSDAGARYRIVPHAHVHDANSPTAQIVAEHPWSKIEIHVPARLLSLNASSGKISLPFSIGVFTLAQLEAPLLRKALGRDPYVKITATAENTSLLNATQFNQDVHFYFADVNQNEKNHLANILVTMLSDYYKKYFPSGSTQTIQAPRSLESLQAPITKIALAPAAPVTPPPKERLAPNAPVANFAFSEHTETRYSELLAEAGVKITKNAVRAVKKNIDLTVIKALITIAVIGAIAAYVISHADDTDFIKNHAAEAEIFKKIAGPKRLEGRP